MKKKLLALCLVTSLAMTLSGCKLNISVGDEEQPASQIQSSKDITEDKSSTQSSETNDEQEEPKDITNADNTTSDKESGPEDVEETNEPTDDKKEETGTEESTDSYAGNNGTLQDGKWVNFDKMQFAVNGKTYTLGVTTLQEMIDDGVPFNEDDLANAGNNINPDYQSGDFEIELGEYWSAEVCVGNYTDENIPANELPIVEFYLPNHPDETQNILSFAFPLDLTEEQLLSQCGEPDEKDLRGLENEYGTNSYEYIKESEVYYSDSSVQFEFVKGELRYFYMTYMP